MTERRTEENRGSEFLSETETALVQKTRDSRILAHLVYFLYILSFFSLGMTDLLGVIIAYIARAQLPPKESLLKEHFTWQIGTFWVSFILILIALIFSFIIIIPLILGTVATVWFVFRIIKGWISLMNNRSPYA